MAADCLMPVPAAHHVRNSCPAHRITRLQGAFKRVAADVEALGHELAALLRKRLLAAPDQAGLDSRLGNFEITGVQRPCVLAGPQSAYSLGAVGTCHRSCG